MRRLRSGGQHPHRVVRIVRPAAIRVGWGHRPSRERPIVVLDGDRPFREQSDSAAWLRRRRFVSKIRWLSWQWEVRAPSERWSGTLCESASPSQEEGGDSVSARLQGHAGPRDYVLDRLLMWDRKGLVRNKLGDSHGWYNVGKWHAVLALPYRAMIAGSLVGLHRQIGGLIWIQLQIRDSWAATIWLLKAVR